MIAGKPTIGQTDIGTIGNLQTEPVRERRLQTANTLCRWDQYKWSVKWLVFWDLDE